MSQYNVELIPLAQRDVKGFYNITKIIENNTK